LGRVLSRIFFGFFRFRVISGWAELGFGFLVAQVISVFESFGSGSGQVLGHLISCSLGFWVISGRAGPCWVLGHLISSSIGFQVILSWAGPSRVLYCDVLFWVGLNFRSGWISGRQTFKKF
jgi:hypothetical protein